MVKVPGCLPCPAAHQPLPESRAVEATVLKFTPSQNGTYFRIKQEVIKCREEKECPAIVGPPPSREVTVSVGLSAFGEMDHKLLP